MPRGEIDWGYQITLALACFCLWLLIFVVPAAFEIDGYLRDDGLKQMTDSMRRMGFLPK